MKSDDLIFSPAASKETYVINWISQIQLLHITKCSSVAEVTGSSRSSQHFSTHSTDIICTPLPTAICNISTQSTITTIAQMWVSSFLMAHQHITGHSVPCKLIITGSIIRGYLGHGGYLGHWIGLRRINTPQSNPMSQVAPVDGKMKAIKLW